MQTKEYRIVQSNTREHLQKQVNTIISDAPYEWEIVDFAVVNKFRFVANALVGSSLVFYQTLVKTTWDDVKTGLMDAETGVVEQP